MFVGSATTQGEAVGSTLYHELPLIIIYVYRFSYPHGQCRSVGVGGYLLGGGMNWLGTYNKYGYG